MNPIIYWFRQDLRLDDLPGLLAAASTARPVLPCFIFDPQASGRWAPGGAARWWLHHSLASLSANISGRGGKLLVFKGDTLEVLQNLATVTGAAGIYCSRGYEPWAAAQECRLIETFKDSACEFQRFPGSLLFEPEQIANSSGLPFKVFTPFWRACLRQPPPAAPRDLPANLEFAGIPAGKHGPVAADSLEDLSLLPRNPDWAAHWTELWEPGEAGARTRLTHFIGGGLSRYSEGRDHPELDATSLLSPHLHWGEISPRQVWHVADCSGLPHDQVSKFHSELGWREFSRHLLHHFPDIQEKPFRAAFADFPWIGKKEHLAAWQNGYTGYPIVDAGMRQLWKTGFMHNRVRMVVASFLTKHLLLPWQAGADWFWDTLVDADLASNACGWQWAAGSGADAAPYFRIFNPTAQGERFDRDGSYVRRWLPELAGLPNRFLHQPWNAPPPILSEAGIELGRDYPEPIVDHRAARQAALDAYSAIRQSS
jgi:deoxyribodipyrimidine photo-lyase